MHIGLAKPSRPMFKFEISDLCVNLFLISQAAVSVCEVICDLFSVNKQTNKQVNKCLPTKIHSESEVPLPDIVRTTRDVLPGNASKTVLFFFFSMIFAIFIDTYSVCPQACIVPFVAHD